MLDKSDDLKIRFGNQVFADSKNVKTSIDGETFDSAELQGMLNGQTPNRTDKKEAKHVEKIAHSLQKGKVKGNEVKFDVDGDNIWDYSMNSKDFGQAVKNRRNSQYDATEMSTNSTNKGEKENSLVSDELMIEGTSGKEKKSYTKDKMLLLKDAKASGISADDLGKEVGKDIKDIKSAPKIAELPKAEEPKDAVGVSYIVQNGDNVNNLAKKFFPNDEGARKDFIENLRSANPDEIRKYANNVKGKPEVEGFQVGHTIYLPGVKSDDVKDTKTKEQAEADYQKYVKANGKGANKETSAPNKTANTSSFKQNGVTYNVKINSAGEKKYEVEKPQPSADGEYTVSDGDKRVTGQAIKLADGSKGLKFQIGDNITRTYSYNDKPSNPKVVREIKKSANRTISTEFNITKGTVTELTKSADESQSRPIMVRFIDASGMISVLRSLNSGEYEILHLDANQKVLDAKRVKDSDKDISSAMGELCK